MPNTNKDNTNTKKEIRVTTRGIELKEEDGEFYSYGFIATTHPDRAADPELGVDGDILSKEVLQQITDAINNSVAPIDSIGSTRTVSLQHDWVKENNPDLEPAGMVVPPAELKQMDGGNWGVYVKVHHNKSHPQFEDIKYKVEHGYLPGYSIEYMPGESTTVSIGDKIFRFLKSISTYVGHAFASARKIANPSALITEFGYKEIEMEAEKKESVSNFESVRKKKGMSVGEFYAVPRDPPSSSKLPIYDAAHVRAAMARFNQVQGLSASEKKSARSKILRAAKKFGIEVSNFSKESDLNMEEETMETKEEEVVEQPKPEEKVEEAKQEDATVEKEEEKKEEESPVEKEDEKVEEKEVKVDTKEIVSQVLESKEFKESIDSLKVETKTLKTKGEQRMDINIKEMKEAFVKGDLVSAKEAALRYASENDIFTKAVNDPANYTRGFKSNLDIKVSGKGLKAVEMKDTLVVGDNPSSFTQSNVEFADVFAPGIIDTFNNQTNLFGFLGKEQHIGGNYYQWKMVTTRDPSSNSTFVAQDDVTVKKNFATKLNYQTPLKIARRGVSVSDFMIRYSAKSLPDLFGLELDLQMKELLKDVNKALFAEIADGTGTSPLGLEAVADSAGNTTLYGLTRSTANRLSPDSAGDTYTAVGGNLTEALIRAKVKQLEVEGSRFGDIAILASPASRDYLFNLLDGNRRFNTTEASFGFSKANVPSYDGTPVIVDSDCNADAIYVIDTSTDVIVVGMSPQLTNLAKVGAATEAYLQMDFAHVYKQPRKIGMLDTLSGP